MTYSNYVKEFKQLKSKPEKLKKYIKHNAPKKRSCGISLKRCNRCGRIRGHISKYGLHLCRQCFRKNAINLGFKKYS
ncbi:30S ribosomal protein S14 [Candidatus Woesearchaeota archaeon]|nr:30S ribosomal protein S14 [Candidatus Woesearchaeota archaeon]|tara:strand:- start:3751 stop:3981 length:231 start_codon:yes stop_codon:yes gene_type:complete